MNLVKISKKEFINFDHVQRVSMSTTQSGFYVRVDFDDSDTSLQYSGDEAMRIAAYCDINTSFDCTLVDETDPTQAEVDYINKLESRQGKRRGG